MGSNRNAPRRIVRPLDAIAVDLACRHPWDECVPIVVRAIVGGIDADNPRRTGIVDMVEQQQLDPGGVTRVDREIHAAAGQYCPEWRAAAFPDPAAGFGRSSRCASAAVVMSCPRDPGQDDGADRAGNSFITVPRGFCFSGLTTLLNRMCRW